VLNMGANSSSANSSKQYRKVPTIKRAPGDVAMEEGTAGEELVSIVESNEVGETGDDANEDDDDEDDEAMTNEPDFDYPVGPLRGPFAISDVPDVPLCISSCLFKGRLGRLYVCRWCPHLCGERIWCMMGPCWPMMLLTFSLIIGIAGSVFFWASYHVHWTLVGVSP